MNKGPNFIVPGFPKAGTTWLFEKLSELPDFSMPLQKELHYFDRSQKYASSNYLNVTNLKKRLFNIPWFAKSLGHTLMKVVKLDFKSFKFYINWYFKNYDDKWYLSLFNKEGLSGDITPTYCLLDETDILEMSKILRNDLKLIFILRNPVDRAWSHFRMQMKNDKKYDVNFYKSEDIINFLKSKPQVDRTSYLECIERYQKCFPNNSIYITFYDFLNESPVEFLENIVEYLGGNRSNVRSHCKVKKKVHKSLEMEIPIEIKEYLEDYYYPLTNELSLKFGGYCTNWLTNLSTTVDPKCKVVIKKYFII